MGGEGGMPFGEESLMEMFKEIESNPELSDMMEGLMERFMSKEVLYEGLSELHTKFQEWMETKGDTLSESDRVQYQTQLDSIQRVLAVYDANENDENTSAEAEALLKQMESLGTLPDEVLESIGKPGGDAPCCIM